jgi:uncharacterized membrane protein YccC
VNKSISVEDISSALNWVESRVKRLDPLSAQLAIKCCLAIVVGQSIALWLGWSASIVAITVLMIHTRYLGSTLDRAILRIAGGLGGSVVALFVMALFPQDRFLFIATIALLTVIGIYRMQVSRYPYAWFIGNISLTLVAFTNIVTQNPYGTFEYAVTWTSGISLGVVAILFIHGIFWPNPAGKDFEMELKYALESSRELFTLKVRAIFEAQPSLHEVASVEKRLIMLLPELRKTLATAALDTGRFHNYQQRYSDLLDQLGTLARLIVAFGETISACVQYSSSKSVLAESNSLRSAVHSLEGMLDDLIAALSQDRSGKANPGVADYRNDVDEKLKVLVEDLKLQIHNVMELSVIATMVSKLNELAYHIVDLRIFLASVENKEIRLSTQDATQALPEVQTLFGLKDLRFRKAAMGGIIVVMACTLWITTNWPYAYRLMLFAMVPILVNAMVPWLPPRPLLKSLLFGSGVAFSLYFLIMPQLDGYWQLAPVLIIALFPFCYFMNSFSPATSAMSLASGIWVFELISISQPQSYSFTAFMNGFIGISGGVGLGLLTLAVFSPHAPEQEFKKQLALFFGKCEKTIKELQEYKPWEARGKSILTSIYKELMNNVRLCGLWSTMLNYDRAEFNDKTKVGSILEAIFELVFRLESFEHARREFKDESLILSLKDKSDELRRALIEAFLLIKNSVSQGEHIPELPDISDLIERVRADLEGLRDQVTADEHIRELAGQVLVVTGSYLALAESIGECRHRVNALDWQAWDQAYFG